MTKPLLKFLTTIDFGNVTYEADFDAAVKRAGLGVVYSGAIARGLDARHGSEGWGGKWWRGVVVAACPGISPVYAS